MELNEYQKQAMTTCTESSRNFSYMMLNLVGEVGELASKIAKMVRKEELTIIDDDLRSGCSFPEYVAKTMKCEKRPATFSGNYPDSVRLWVGTLKTSPRRISKNSPAGKSEV